MEDFNSIIDILDFAIANEQDAIHFYQSLAKRTKDHHMAKVYEQYTLDEMAHKTRLELFKQDKKINLSLEKIRKIKRPLILPNVDPNPNMSYKEALIVSVKKEQASFDLYMALASISEEDEEIQSAFIALAQDELKHRETSEKEYLLLTTK